MLINLDFQMLSFDKILLIIISLYIIVSNKNSNKNLLYSHVYDNPLVSIIIPVHNNIKYTLSCISSILTAESSIFYEIIIANDLSTDKTNFLIKKYFQKYKNIHIYNNNKIYNFLLNCNHAFKQAKGKYYSLLN